MRCFRIVSQEYASPEFLLTGEGASEEGGRWNTIGGLALYTAPTYEVAAAEKGYYSIRSNVEFYLANKTHDPFRDLIARVGLKIATLEVSDDLQLLDLTNQEILSDLLRQAGLPPKTVQEGRQSPFKMIGWTQALGEFLSTQPDVHGLRVMSARSNNGEAIVLYPNRYDVGKVQILRVDDIVLSATDITGTPFKKGRTPDPARIFVFYGGTERLVAVLHFPIV